MCNFFRILSVFTIILCIMGCRYQIRSNNNLIPQVYHAQIVNESKDKRFASRLLNKISALESSSKKEESKLVLSGIKTNEKDIGYNPVGGKQSIWLTKSVDYELISRNKDIIKSGNIHAHRSINRYSSQEHKFGSEKKLIELELEDELIDLLLQDLKHVE